MNKKDVIKTVSEKTQIDAAVCRVVIESFEEQMGDSLLERIKGVKNNRSEFTEKVAEKAGIDTAACEEILGAFKEALGEGLTNKIKFWK